jgi:hypothetical protein
LSQLQDNITITGTLQLKSVQQSLKTSAWFWVEHFV